MDDQIEKQSSSGKTLIVLAALVAVCAIAVMTRLWVLTAIPIGFLFGFVLKKGDLCGASAFSEVVLMKDGRKSWGLWVAIVTSMAGFAALDLLGFVQLNPKPFLWASYVVGGILFGIGMVLAGGCVSGTLYKAGAGHTNSLVALLGIPIGIALVEYGPLSSLSAHLKTINGGRVTFSSLTGLPFWSLALVFAVVTIGVSIWQRSRPEPAGQTVSASGSLGRALRARSWKPWQAGLLVGILGTCAYLSSAASGRNYPLGVTHGVLHAQMLLTDGDLDYVYQPAAAPSTPAGEQPAPARRKVSLWLIALVASLVAGSWFAGRLSGESRLIGKPPEQIVVSIVGSILLGAGAAIAAGCVIGNVLSGIALMSVGTVLFTVVVVLANWLTTYIYLMGGSLRISTR